MANTIRLTWGEVDGAHSYNIYHSQQPGLSVARTPLLTNTANLSFDHSGLVPASTHYYIVASVGPNGEIGPPSNEISIVAGILLSIAVTPANMSIHNGVTQQYTATGTFADSSTADITNLVVWSTGNNIYASITADGLLTANFTGTTSVTATFNAISGSTNVTVFSTVSSIVVTPANSTFAAPHTAQYTATGHYTDGYVNDVTSNVTWGSTNTSVATISGSGFLTSGFAGSSTISATLGLVTGNTSVTITKALQSIAVTPSNPSIVATNTQQFTATGTYTDTSTADITGSVMWTSDTPSVGTITSSGGLFSAILHGTSTITATLGLISGNTLATVTRTLVSIAVTPSSPTIAFPNTQQMTATGTYNDGSTADLTSTATWASDNTNAATINASGGLLTVHHAGVANITATSSPISGSTPVTVTVTLTSIAVTPTNPTIAVPNTQQMTATGTYNDGSTADVTSTAAWSSGTPADATVNSTGLVTAVGAGSSIITATISAISGNTTATITAGGPTITLVNNTVGNDIIYVEGMGVLTSGGNAGNMAFINNGYYYSTSDGNSESLMYYSTDGGTTITPVTTLEPFFLVNGGDGGYVFSMWSTATKFYIVGDGTSEGSSAAPGISNFYTSTDGINWTAGTIIGSTSGGLPQEVMACIHGTSTSNMWAVSNSNTFSGTGIPYSTTSNAYQSTDGGTTWTHMKTFYTRGVDANNLYPNVVYTISPTDVWVGGNHNLWHYNGTTWTDVSTTLATTAGTAFFDINSIWASGTNDVWFVNSNGTEPNVYRSTDQGASFTGFNLSSLTGTNGGMWQVGGQGANLVMVVAYAHLGHGNWLQTTDHGTTWTQVYPTNVDDLVCIYPQDSHNIWVVGQNLIHYQD